MNYYLLHFIVLKYLKGYIHKLSCLNIMCERHSRFYHEHHHHHHLPLGKWFRDAEASKIRP